MAMRPAHVGVLRIIIVVFILRRLSALTGGDIVNL